MAGGSTTTWQESWRGSSISIQDDLQVSGCYMAYNYYFPYCLCHCMDVHSWMLYTLAVHFIYFRYGCTKILISDQGREFVNKVNESLFQRFKTDNTNSRLLDSSIEHHHHNLAPPKKKPRIDSSFYQSLASSWGEQGCDGDAQYLNPLL